MKRNKHNKEVSRLRAEVEILRARLKGAGDSQKQITLRDSTFLLDNQSDYITSVSTEYLKRDLGKTLLLTLLAFFLIFFLKLFVLPNQEKLAQNIVNLYQSTASTLDKLK